MRKIIVFNMITLDGYFADENGNIDWHQVDDEFNEFAVEQTAEFGGIIFGKTTYQMFEEYWPAELKNPKTSSEDRKIAQMIDDTWKLVFSKTLKEVTWNNSKLYHEIDPEEVKHWKEYDGKDMVIMGSGTIVQQFTNLGLIDEYRLMVNPIVLGEGKPLFDNLKEKLDLKLLKSREFKNGNVLLYYEPKK
jgi:dihydrofolate reductase